MPEPTRRSSTVLILVALVALMSACAWQQNAPLPAAHEAIRPQASKGIGSITVVTASE